VKANAVVDAKVPVAVPQSAPVAVPAASAPDAAGLVAAAPAILSTGKNVAEVPGAPVPLPAAGGK